MLVVYQPVSGEMKDRVVAKVRAGGGSTIGGKIDGFELLACRSQPHDLFGFKATEAQAYEVLQSGLGGSSRDIFRDVLRDRAFFRGGVRILTLCSDPWIGAVEYRIGEDRHGFLGGLASCRFAP